MVPSPNPKLIQRGSSSKMKIPRLIISPSMLRSGSLRACRLATLNARTKPARNKNVGAQRWVTQRVMNWAAGISEPAGYQLNESLAYRPALNTWEAWSIAMSTMTMPRMVSMAGRRVPVKTGASVCCGPGITFC